MASFMYSTTINNNHNNYDILFSYFDGKSAIEVQVWVPCEFDVWSTQRVTLVGGDRSHLEPHLAEEAA